MNTTKLRSDSHWSKLNKEQRQRLEKWLFDDGLTYEEVLQKAKSDLGIAASLSSLKRYRARAVQDQLLYQLTDGTAIARCPKRANGQRKYSHAMASRLAGMRVFSMFLGQPDQEKNLIAMLRLMVRDGAAAGMAESMEKLCELKADWLTLKKEMAEFEVTKFFLRKHLKDNQVQTKQPENGSPESEPARVFPERIKND
jgi:hypothetical protein